MKIRRAALDDDCAKDHNGGFMADDGLNPSQRKAVNTLSGPMLVLAGAGSGKTRVITFRIARLIASGVVPTRILAVTFTNKAAREMKQRAGKLLGRKKNQGSPEISTFHSLCVKILRRNIHRLGYPKEFPLYDQGDQERLVRQALRNIRVSQDIMRPSDLLSYIGSWKSKGIRPAQAIAQANTEKEELAAQAYEKYQQALRASGAVDFDDLLLCTEEIFDKFPEVRLAEAARYDHLLIDEYQDTNGPQYRIVKTLAERHRNICVVGDDDQSIYGWRGAEVSHILNFHKDWRDATVVRLEENYRSQAPILHLANRLIANNKVRHDKVLRPMKAGTDSPRFIRFEDEHAEATAVVREIADLIDTERKDRIVAGNIAILFRTNEQPRAFEEELRKLRIPYLIVGGQSFFDRREVKDVISYLRVLAYPQDEVALLRIINTPSRGIGTATLEPMMKCAVGKGLPLWEVLDKHLDEVDLGSGADKSVRGFHQLILNYQARLGKDPLRDIVTSLLNDIAYRAELNKSYKTAKEADARWNGVEELVNSIAMFEERNSEASLQDFLEESALAGKDDPREDKDKHRDDAITLMTMHSAKGLEFPHVYMVGMEEGILPHQRTLIDGTIEEERRLAYVGVTRAQDHAIGSPYCGH